MAIVDPTLGPWASARLPASWRGVPFRVRESELKRGRRTAVHEYPERDDVWVEDMGRATRVTAFRGFLGGDDVDQQLRAMLDAAEQPGDGELVHPALGSITASLIECTARDTEEQGRVWTLEFVFISGSQRVYPASAANTQNIVLTAAGAADMTTTSSFGVVGDTIAGVYHGIQAGVATVQAGINTVHQLTNGVQMVISGTLGLAHDVVGDVTTLGRAVTGITGGNFGRFSFGARLGAIPGLGSVQGALNQANAAAGSIGSLTNRVASLANLL